MRYIGGKYRIKKHITNYLMDYLQNDDYNCFVEPFCGSCNIVVNMFEDLPMFRLDKIILNDIHKDLIMMWKAVVYDGWVPPSKFTKEQYEELRNSESSALRGFIGHGCSFGGIWFSQFAITNDGRNYCLNAKNSIDHVGEFLIGANENGCKVEFYNNSYNELDIPDGSLVYCDPPYTGTSKPGSCREEFDHEKFWQWVRELSTRCNVFTSEYIAPDDFESVLKIEVKLDMGKREDRVERLFKYKY